MIRLSIIQASLIMRYALGGHYILKIYDAIERPGYPMALPVYVCGRIR